MMLQTPDIVILAAGQGKRMRSELPKVLHPVLGQPMLHYVVDLALAIPHGAITVVVGHGADEVRASCTGYPMLQFVEQKERLGSGHAVLETKRILENLRSSVVILCGDVIMLEPMTLTRLIESKSSDVSASVLTTRLQNPKGYGRIIRNHRGEVQAIREETDCSDAERALTEINAGTYVFDNRELFANLSRVERANAQKEYYLTDVIRLLAESGKRVVGHSIDNAEEAIGINDRVALQSVERTLQKRVSEAWMLAGVSMECPETTFIDRKTALSNDVRIEGGCHILDSRIESGVSIESGSRIVRSRIGRGSRIKQGSYITEATLGEGVSVGPYAHVRPNSNLKGGVKLGNFVEVKNSTIGEGSKASHLSYIGDATVGSEVNIGCGFVTCNYDGGSIKHHTTIGDRVFIGSDSQAVAPVTIGADSYVASGTTVTEDVPSHSLVLSRGRQVIKPGYVGRNKKLGEGKQ